MVIHFMTHFLGIHMAGTCTETQPKPDLNIIFMLQKSWDHCGAHGVSGLTRAVLSRLERNFGKIGFICQRHSVGENSVLVLLAFVRTELFGESLSYHLLHYCSSNHILLHSCSNGLSSNSIPLLCPESLLAKKRLVPRVNKSRHKLCAPLLRRHLSQSCGVFHWRRGRGFLECIFI